MIKKTLSIVIPTYNNDKYIIKILNNLSQCKIPESLQEILVIENGPKNKTENICQEKEGILPIKYFYSKTPSAGLARNIGVTNSKSDIIIFFDNDMAIHENTLIEYDKIFQQHDEKCFYGGPIIANYEKKPPEWLNNFLPWSAKGYSLGNNVKYIDINNNLFLGGNHAVPRSAFSKINGYDSMCAEELLGMVGEETRLQERLLKNGYKGVYIPKAIAYHWVPKDRCSQEWTLQRHYRMGLTEGELLKKELPNKYCSILRIPCYILKEYILTYIYLFKYRLLKKQKNEIFKIKCNLSKIKGKIYNFH